MTSEILAHLLRVNLVGGAAILAVLILRGPARRLFGPQTAYLLWAAPPLAALATLMPARTVADAQDAGALADAVAGFAGPALVVWAIGMMAAFAVLGHLQARFAAAVKAGRAGPAVVGFVAPRIVMPAEASIYDEAERALIRAHEREHVARQDPRASALAAVMQAVCWFNPLVHVAAAVMRLDQELACDAAVLRRRPHTRCLYAKTLLKTQLATQALPFGCHWPAPRAHPLEVRIGQLRDPRRHDGLAGPILIGGFIACGAVTAWSVQPPVPRHQPPIIALWEAASRGPTMSVMLITLPPGETSLAQARAR